MNGTLFLAIMIGVAWLVIWCCADHSKANDVWWPFEMKSNDEKPSRRGKRGQAVALQPAVKAPVTPWRQPRR